MTKEQIISWLVLHGEMKTNEKEETVEETVEEEDEEGIKFVDYAYVSTLPGGDETMLHSVHIVIIRRMAISDIPVPIW